MVEVRPQTAQGLPLLCGGIAAGLLFALITRVGGANPTAAVLLAGLPFCLAAMTGVAKTTTA